MNHDFNERLDELESESESESEGGDGFSVTILRQDTDGETHYRETIEDWGR